MTAISPEDEFERNWLWIGIDEIGCVGVFQSFGEAAIPLSVQYSLDDAETMFEFIDSDLRHRKSSCEGRFVYENQRYSWGARYSSDKYDADWQRYLSTKIRIAATGVFVYEAHMGDQPPVGYFLAAVPSEPIHLESLPHHIRAIAERNLFPNQEFANLLYLTANDIYALAGPPSG